MLHVILAAALATAAVKPLFVPPAAMKPIAEDAWIRDEIKHSPETDFVAEYRGVAKVKPDWSPFTYHVPETIAVVRHRSKASAAEWGIRTFTGLGTWRPSAAFISYCAAHGCVAAVPRLQKIAAEPVTLCHGQPGWLNVFVRDTETYHQVFAKSGDAVYVALLHYANGTGDVLNAAHSLRTLCPPFQAQAADLATRLPFAPPAGWIRGVDTPQFDGRTVYKPIAYWMYLAPPSMIMQSLFAAQAPDASEYITPQEEADDRVEAVKSVEKDVRIVANREMKLCNAEDGWFTQFTATDTHGLRYTEELSFGYGNDASYIVRYVRDAREPENPAAHKALLSLCPPR